MVSIPILPSLIPAASTPHPPHPHTHIHRYSLSHYTWQSEETSSVSMLLFFVPVTIRLVNQRLRQLQNTNCLSQKRISCLIKRIADLMAQDGVQLTTPNEGRLGDNHQPGELPSAGELSKGLIYFPCSNNKENHVKSIQGGGWHQSGGIYFFGTSQGKCLCESGIALLA